MGFFEFLTKSVPQKEKKKKADKDVTEVSKNGDDSFKPDSKNIDEYRPRSFDDVAAVIDELLVGKPAIVYLTEVRDNTSQRVLDILSGAIYAIGGTIGELGDEVYLLTPDGGK